MGAAMAGLERKRFDSADETRPFADKGQVELVSIAGGVVAGNGRKSRCDHYLPALARR